MSASSWDDDVQVSYLRACVHCCVGKPALGWCSALRAAVAMKIRTDRVVSGSIDYREEQTISERLAVQALSEGSALVTEQSCVRITFIPTASSEIYKQSS